ncbi:hypothetical protein EDB85DRAFT_1894536 [Lactarius pseudohatsudake]|nr:hypothetical protein EDB85DRAFT_1894536 [Lactarius pseudohatsudake]
MNAPLTYAQPYGALPPYPPIHPHLNPYAGASNAQYQQWNYGHYPTGPFPNLIPNPGPPQPDNAERVALAHKAEGHTAIAPGVGGPRAGETGVREGRGRGTESASAADQPKKNYPNKEVHERDLQESYSYSTRTYTHAKPIRAHGHGYLFHRDPLLSLSLPTALSRYSIPILATDSAVGVRLTLLLHFVVLAEQPGVFWRMHRVSGSSAAIVLKKRPFVLPSASWSPSCSWSGGHHVVVVVVVVATAVVSRSQSSLLSSPWGHCGHSRGRVVAASLYRSSSSLPLPPHIGMAVVVVVITSELHNKVVVAVHHRIAVATTRGHRGSRRGRRAGVVELIELVEVVLDVDELDEELEIEDDDNELEAIKSKTEEGCGEGDEEGLGDGVEEKTSKSRWSVGSAGRGKRFHILGFDNPLYLLTVHKRTTPPLLLSFRPSRCNVVLLPAVVDITEAAASRGPWSRNCSAWAPGHATAPPRPAPPSKQHTRCSTVRQRRPQTMTTRVGWCRDGDAVTAATMNRDDRAATTTTMGRPYGNRNDDGDDDDAAWQWRLQRQQRLQCGDSGDDDKGVEQADG